MRKFVFSLPMQILGAVLLGLLAGEIFPVEYMKPFSEIGKLIVHWVKLIAGPFLFLTIVASVVEVQVTAKHGFKVVLIAMFNTAIAIVIGMTLAKVFLTDLSIPKFEGLVPAKPVADISIGLGSWLKTLSPPSLFAPFVQNEILMIALLALITGLALRKVYLPEGPTRLRVVAEAFEKVRAVPAVLLTWLIHIIPVAVLAVVAGAVAEHGFQVFFSLFQYVVVVILGFILQVLLVYGFWIFGVARFSPRKLWAQAREPVLYAFGVNSSLATLPLTLKALERLGVSKRSASLGAGVATNLNNDGIVLYEALAVLFVAQLSHIQLSDSQMVLAALSCIVASMGITGIPEAGFISLSVVITTMGLPVEALPLLLAVDWILARLRSVVNVLSDMTLSIALDATESAK